MKKTNEEMLDFQPCIINEYDEQEYVQNANCLKAMSQAVQQRDEEIKGWIETNKMTNLESAHIRGFNDASDQILNFISISQKLI